MKYFLLFLMGIYSFLTQAQTRIISGTALLVDTSKSDTTELIGAAVCLLNNLDSSKKGTLCLKGTQTDADGKFAIDCDSGFHYMEVSYPGAGYSIIKIPGDVNYFRIFLPWKKDSVVIQPIYPLSPGINKKSYVAKPAIYLYPPQTTTISIKHDFKGTIGTTYPAYNNGWHVQAKPDGTLLNMADNRTYEYLFWDGSCTFPDEHFAFKDGFVVPKKGLPDFLLEKLSLIGLNNKEINDFIVYWLPILNKNETSFIHFRINDNIDNASILTVSPKPDSWIRLFMEYKEVDEGYTIPEQKLEKLPRKGFTLVEWGGSNIAKLTKIQ